MSNKIISRHSAFTTKNKLEQTDAQISENHNQLINEVVEMVENDLDQQANMSQRHSYTAEILKQQYKTLKDAKAHFNLKANSWDALVNQLNALLLQSPVAEDSPQPSQNLNGKQGNNHTEFERLTVFLEPDVAQMFPTSEAVNEALRFLIRVASKSN